MTRFDALRLMYEHNPLRITDLPPAQVQDVRAFVKQLFDEGYVKPYTSNHGPFYLTNKGRTCYLELQDAVDKEVQRRAQEEAAAEKLKAELEKQQAQEMTQKYDVTLYTCSCGDKQRRHVKHCKHMYRLWIERGYLE